MTDAQPKEPEGITCPKCKLGNMDETETHCVHCGAILPEMVKEDRNA